MNIFDLLESPGMGRPRDTNGIQSAADQSAASVIGSGTTKREAKKKPVTMMGVGVKEAVEEAAVKPNFKMPPESLQDKMYRQHQELRKQRGAPSAEEYKQRIAQKQAEIDALKESSYASDKNYKQADAYKNYNIYVGKNPFVKQSTGEKFYIAVTNIGKHEFKEKGVTQQEAVDAVQNKIDEILNAQQRVSASATLDFNVKFATDILGNPRESFYAKVINVGGEPKLIIAGKEMLDFGRELVGLGFKPSALRIDPESETATALPSISYSSRQIKDTGLIANGRYEIGDMKTDNDGNRVFDLTYHSTAHTKSDKMRLNKPAVTVGTTRSVEVNEGILDRAIPKMPKPRNPADSVLRNKVNAGGRHLDKKRRQELAPKHKHQDPLAESTGQLNWTVHFDDGTSQRVTIPSDEFDVRGYFAKRGKKVVKIDYSFAAQDRQDAPRRGTDDPAAGADSLAKAQSAYDRGLTEQEVEEEFRLGKKLGTRRDRFKSLRKRKEGILGEVGVSESQAVKITDYDTWSDEVKALGGEIHPQKDRNVLVAQSWDGEEIGKFHLGKSMGFINQQGVAEGKPENPGRRGFLKALAVAAVLSSTPVAKLMSDASSKMSIVKHRGKLGKYQGSDIDCTGYNIGKKQFHITVDGEPYTVQTGTGSGFMGQDFKNLDFKSDPYLQKIAPWLDTKDEYILQIADYDIDLYDQNNQKIFPAKDQKQTKEMYSNGFIDAIIGYLDVYQTSAIQRMADVPSEPHYPEELPAIDKGSKGVSAIVSKAAGNDPIHIARLASLAKSGYDAITKKPDAQQSAPKAAPAALPAPSDDNVLRPKLKKQKEKSPVNRQGVEEDVAEGWKGKLAGAALAGAAALGGGDVDAQNINLPGPQVSYVAHVTAEANGREVHRTVNLGSNYSSEQEAYDDIESSLQAKGITRYNINIEQKYDAQYYPGSNQPRGGTATGREYSAPGIGDMVIKHIGREIRAGIPDRGGYATGGTNQGQRPRDGSQWWKDQLPRIKEDTLEEDIESHLYLMSRAGYDIVQEEWSDKYKDSINCSNPKGFSQKAHCAGKKKNKSVSEAVATPPAQTTDPYQQKLLDRMGARFGLQPGATMDQVQAAQQAHLDKNDPAAAAQYKQNMTNIDTGNTAANKPVQLAPKTPNPDTTAALAAGKANKSPTAIMLSQPGIGQNQAMLDAIAPTLGLPVGSSLEQLLAADDARHAKGGGKYAPSSQPVGEDMNQAVDSKGRTQQQWMQLLKDKFPDAKIIQSKMINGPCQAILSDGRKLSWSKVKEDVAEEKVRLDPKCWTGKKIGNPKTKMKGGVRVNNCVPKESKNG